MNGTPLLPRGPGLFWWRGAPQFGRQDQGHSPGGVQDRFSRAAGNILVGQPRGALALEMVVPPRRITVLRDCWIVLTGGAVHARASGTITHREVHFVRGGTEICFTSRRYGWRTYLCFREAPEGAPQKGPGRVGNTGSPGHRNPAGSLWTGWRDPEGAIRVLPGPEHHILKRPDDFLESRWTTTEDMSDMGIRLEGPPVAMADAQMVSAPVTDGTVQLTPGGPIVLMRHRQTVGGYPRVWVVISTDVDTLAQYGPGQHIRFREVTLEEAQKSARRQAEALGQLEKLR